MEIDRTKIKLAMLRVGIRKYKDLAQKVGCSRQNLSIILNRGSCSPATLAKLADALGVEPAALLSESEVRTYD